MIFISYKYILKKSPPPTSYTINGSTYVLLYHMFKKNNYGKNYYSILNLYSIT